MIPPIHSPKVHKFAIEQGELIEQLPEFIQSHVKMVIDVKADGHCGYQAVAHALGRGEESYMEIHKKLNAEIKKQTDFFCKEYTFSNIDQTLASIYPIPSEPVGTKNWMSMHPWVKQWQMHLKAQSAFSPQAILNHASLTFVSPKQVQYILCFYQRHTIL
ncbi:hypothetical protein VP01_11216g1 [Puccinia sorghi]|uniref:OTU domain-containing protein n=1 Tax=Puccinia sorghi TaxID=27349 RepID=A0A0L6VSK9_9BASI|nr:hypothetical protein VP01_11216g1 [Puccinia sorghi]